MKLCRCHLWDSILSRRRRLICNSMYSLISHARPAAPASLSGRAPCRPRAGTDIEGSAYWQRPELGAPAGTKPGARRYGRFAGRWSMTRLRELRFTDLALTMLRTNAAMGALAERSMITSAALKLATGIDPILELLGERLGTVLGCRTGRCGAGHVRADAWRPGAHRTTGAQTGAASGSARLYLLLTATAGPGTALIASPRSQSNDLSSRCSSDDLTGISIEILHEFSDSNDGSFRLRCAGDLAQRDVVPGDRINGPCQVVRFVQPVTLFLSRGKGGVATQLSSSKRMVVACCDDRVDVHGCSLEMLLHQGLMKVECVGWFTTVHC